MQTSECNPPPPFFYSFKVKKQSRQWTNHIQRLRSAHSQNESLHSDSVHLCIVPAPRVLLGGPWHYFSLHRGTSTWAKAAMVCLQIFCMFEVMFKRSSLPHSFYIFGSLFLILVRKQKEQTKRNQQKAHRKAGIFVKTPTTRREEERTIRATGRHGYIQVWANVSMWLCNNCVFPACQAWLTRLPGNHPVNVCMDCVGHDGWDPCVPADANLPGARPADESDRWDEVSGGISTWDVIQDWCVWRRLLTEFHLDTFQEGWFGLLFPLSDYVLLFRQQCVGQELLQCDVHRSHTQSTCTRFRERHSTEKSFFITILKKVGES